MKKVYTVEEIVDLGNRVLEIFEREEQAINRCRELQSAYDTKMLNVWKNYTPHPRFEFYEYELKGDKC